MATSCSEWESCRTRTHDMDDMAKLYHNIFLGVHIDIGIITYRPKLFKKASEKSKTAKNTHNRCLYLQTYEKSIFQVCESSIKLIYLCSFFSKIYNVLLLFVFSIQILVYKLFFVFLKVFFVYKQEM